MSKPVIKALSNQAFVRWCQDSPALSAYELAYVIDCEEGNFDEISQNFRAVSGRVHDMGLIAAALNKKYDFIDRFLSVMKSAGTRVNFWNALYSHFPQDYKHVVAAQDPLKLKKTIMATAYDLKAPVIADWLARHPDLAGDPDVLDSLEKYSHRLRHEALRGAEKDLYKILAGFEKANDKTGGIPDFLREDIAFLGMQDWQDTPRENQNKIWRILLDQMDPEWDMSYVVIMSKSLKPYIDYGYRLGDFKHIDHPGYKNVHLEGNKYLLRDMQEREHAILKRIKTEKNVKDVPRGFEIIVRYNKLDEMMEYVPLEKRPAAVDYVRKNLPPLMQRRYAVTLKDAKHTYRVQAIKREAGKKPSLKRRPRP